MVVLTIVTQKKGETVYFEEPIPQAHFMRLVSCRLYNSWHNINRVEQMNLTDTRETLASRTCLLTDLLLCLAPEQD